MSEGINIAVIGLGNIGEWLVSKLCLEILNNNLNINKIVCIGVDLVKLESKLSDIIQSLLILESQHDKKSLCNLISKLFYTKDFTHLENMDYIITAFSVPMNESIKIRSDLLFLNDGLTQKIALQISKFISAHCRIINITNPLDVITWRLQQLSNLPVNQVVGISGQIDTARFIQGIHEIAGIDYRSIDLSSITILGEHGFSAVPILSQIKINQQSIFNILNSETIEKIKSYALLKGTQMMDANQRIPPHIAIAQATINCLKSWESQLQSIMTLCCWNVEYQAFLGTQVNIAKSGIVPTSFPLLLSNEEKKELEFSANCITHDYLKLK